MADTIVKLGDFEFGHAEVPEGIPAGGNQMIHVNKFVGGKRKIVAVGRDDDDITWTGIFFGSNASKRFQALDFMRTQGNLLIFSYLEFKYSVVIKSFTGTVNRYYKIPYSITLTIVEDLANPVVVPPPVGFLDALYDDIATLFDILEMVRQPNIGVAVEVLNQYLNTLLPNEAITKTVRDTLEGHIREVSKQIEAALTGNKSILGGG